MTIDARCKPLASQRLGPFVRLDNGNVLAIDDKSTFVSHDGGQSWSNPRPLFQPDRKVTVSRERALLKTRNGVIILGFANMEVTRPGSYDFYELKFRDWAVIKTELKDFYRHVLALDMNVIFTAREKTQYADGDFAKKTGVTFDGEKSLPYIVDVVLRLYRKTDGFYAHIVKDRGQHLGKRTEISAATPTALYKVIENAFGREHLDRDAEPARNITTVQLDRIVELVRQLDITPDKVKRALEQYNAESFGDLTHDDAETVITNLETRLEATEDKPELDFPS
jgi:hypothetical protein